MTYSKRRKHRLVADPDTIALLASGVRQELVDSLESLGGEAEAAELARELGRPVDGLYYHLDRLARAGLLDVLDAGGSRRYRLRTRPGEILGLDYRSGGAEAEQATGKVVEAMLKIAGRDFRAALQRADTVVDGPLRELWAARGRGWVDADELAEINALLARLSDLLHRPRAAGRDHLLSLCFVLAPLPEQPLRRGE